MASIVPLRPGTQSETTHSVTVSIASIRDRLEAYPTLPAAMLTLGLRTCFRCVSLSFSQRPIAPIAHRC